MPRLGEESRDLEAIRAINEARYAQPRGGSTAGSMPRPMWVYSSRNGFTIKTYRPRNIYANSTSPMAKYTHFTRYGWRAYDANGKLRLTCVRYFCGQSSHNATTSAEPTLPICVKCRIVLVGYEEATHALDLMYNR